MQTRHDGVSIVSELSPAMVPEQPIGKILLHTGLLLSGVTVLRLLLDPILGEAYPYILYVFPAIYLANSAGWRAGTATLVFGLVLAIYLYAPPRYSFRIDHPANRIGLLLYLGVGGACIFLAHTRRIALRKAEAKAVAIARESQVRRKMHEKLQFQQSRLLDHTFDPILTWKPDGLITYWNAGAERLYGYSAHEAVGQFVHRLLRTIFPNGRADFEEALHRDGHWEGELRHFTKDGRWIPVESRMMLVARESSMPEVLEADTDASPKKKALEVRTQLAAIVESSEDAIISKSLDGTIQTWNGAAARLFGFTPGEALGQPIGIIIPPELHDEDRIMFERLRKGERIVNFETTRMTKGGDRLFVTLTISPLRDAEGTITGASAVLRDVTDRKLAEARLRDAMERFRGVVDQAVDAIVTINARGIVETINPAVTRIFGYTPEEVVGRNVSMLMPQPYRGEHDQYIGRYLRTGEARIIGIGREVFGLRKDGTRFPIELSVSEIRVASGRLFTGMIRDITERRMAEEALHLRDRAIQAVDQGIIITSPSLPDNPITYANRGFEKVTGYLQSEILGRNCRFLQGRDSDPAQVAKVREAVRQGRDCKVELVNYKKDGSPFWNALSITPIRDESGALTHFVGVQMDISGRVKLEEQLRQAQKMEAFGQLAGGVAHDFNNLLTIINGYSEYLLEGMESDSQARGPIEAILDAGERAGGLTTQLLAFSRRSVLEPVVLEPNAVVTDTAKMLQRLIGEDIRLVTSLAPQTGRVKVDPGQLGQVLMNLAVNSRDAMPTGGRLTIETRDVVLEESQVGGRDMAPGEYVIIAVSDTGTGMPPEVKARVFEPFFTTKGPGKGTGLGLATAYGIIKQSGGHMDAYSEVGVGTTFKIYLPAVPESEKPKASPALPATIRGGSERVLLVEDQPDVRQLALVALQSHGYRVLEATDGEDALRRVETDRPALDLIVTDVVMPGLSGREVAERLARTYPGIKVLYTSGYTDDAVVRHGILQADVAFLRKPYTPLSLARKVREVLDQP
jgi:PAS domain S-box-containing protein